MKKIFTLLFLTSICYLSNAQRLVLVEEFTQASCPPCETSTPQLNATLIANADKVVQLRYQTSWPGVDPMNADNPEEVQTRVDYYGVTGVPSLRIDGGSATADAVFPVLVTAANINANSAVESPLSLSVTHTLSENLQDATVTVTITNTSDAPYDLASDKLRVAGVEEVIEWPYQPGSTSIVDFEYVMKKFYTGAAGVDVPALAAGESMDMMFTDNIANRVYHMDEFNVVAFIQDDSNRSIINAAESTALEIDATAYGDMGASDITVAPSDFCQETISPSVSFVNEGEATITQATIAAVNGTTVTPFEWTGSIAPGETANFDLGETPLVDGANPVGLVLASINDGQRDINFWNNIPVARQYNKFGGQVMPNEGFEGKTFGDVGEFIVDAPIPLAFVTVTPAEFNQNVGNNSANSLLIDFWTWATVGQTGDMYYGEFDLTDATAPILSLDRAGAQFQGSQDGLAVLVSTDCGGTWTSVYDKRGAELFNNGDLTTGRFFPNANSTWDTDVIDLSAYEGMSNVSIAFRATSAYGNSLYLDNIVVASTTGLNELAEGEALSVYPNPAFNTATIDVTVTEAANVSYRVMDMMGRIIENQVIGTNVSGRVNHTLDVSNYESGTYVVYINVGGREAVQRISVLH